ncbi:Alpha/Beta hydrolase protein [Mycena rosella]|uniref:Carboxylic ester hydrolase n=1 Tax=Mycena rosella TaxID=1033263 RepID=A0AAD7D8U1_MYCRO|nr:Alpha/Beta hydrolase protein [Mycena rosella]
MLPLLLALSTTSFTFAAAGPPVVALQYGVFRGTSDGNLSTFLGVPFASPATRFELPKVPIKLHGVQNASGFGPACPQQAMSTVPLVQIATATYSAVSDDCLTLNVFKPSFATSQSKLPVLVWIYGGGFQVGNSLDTEVRPAVERSIATDEPIIIVTPNYRVSAFGFLGGKEASAAGISNLGLRDQIFALEWVQAHIAAFGGDPEKVVIGGISAGAISIALLLLSNNRFQQSALFRGAFMESGSPINLGSMADGQPYYDGLVAANNCTASPDTLDCLRRVPLDAFTATVNHTANLFSYSSLSLPSLPRVDGDVIVQNPLLSVSQGLYAKVPILTGDCDDEGTLFSLSTTNITTNDEFVGYMSSNYLPRATAAQIAELSALYPDDPTQGSPFDTGTANQLTPEYKRLAAFQGDLIFTGARRFFLERAAKTQDAWSWLYKRGKTSFLGASHGGDIGIWFPAANVTDAPGLDALLNFINTRDPNRAAGAGQHASSVFWPKWNTPSANGSTSLLTFSNPNLVNITAEDFRVEAIEFLFEVLLEETGNSSASG